MEEFQIHQRLLDDCHRLGRLPICHVLLHRNAELPWFILVPETMATDLLDLPAGPRDRVMAEAAAVSAFVKDDLGYPKVNFGAIGNLVPQLHIHHVVRYRDDPAWPAPVWGRVPPRPYTGEALERLLVKLRSAPPDGLQTVL